MKKKLNLSKVVGVGFIAFAVIDVITAIVKHDGSYLTYFISDLLVGTLILENAELKKQLKNKSIKTEEI